MPLLPADRMTLELSILDRSHYRRFDHSVAFDNRGGWQRGRATGLFML